MGAPLLGLPESYWVSRGDAAYLVADCDFRKAYGFALIFDGFGGAPTTLAQGYLAVRDPWNKY